MNEKSHTAAFQIALEPQKKGVFVFALYLANYEYTAVDVIFHSEPITPREQQEPNSEEFPEPDSAQKVEARNELSEQQEQFLDEARWFDDGGSAQMFNPRVNF